MKGFNESVRSLFFHLENGEFEAFFNHVDEKLKWTVMGTHPLAGEYHGKEYFLSKTFARLNKLLVGGVRLRVTNIFMTGNTAIVELESISTAKNGKPFKNNYCWICRFENGKIVEVRAYLDSVAVQNLFDENEEI
ncbi:nuclear transport factor 2 family protein [Xanthovirga aplysinae]|uniref:nuclear transport factor 2 family protein n=1 Tax=Xanthovirga aplysinae TaxID=2529853 RepID=UPI0012BCF6C1|nr:nuclear transport factor 2 family protein [Xanthovirga aplysinae]MTI30986.1 nuclear transport factor 2 family protein [Xanthovirga aplysinae]